MKTSTTISAGLHATALLIAIVNFGVKPLNTPPNETLPVDIVSASDFSKMTKGAKDAPKNNAPKAVVEKVAEQKPVEEVQPKPVEKKEKIETAASQPPPEPKKEEQKPVEKKAEPKKEEPQVDEIAEALKKAEKKKEPKKEEPKKEAKKPEPPQPKFDAQKIAALLDKRDPQRQLATGETINNTASLGAARGDAAQLSQSEIDALRNRLYQCWNPPVGATDAGKINVVLRVLFKPDGSLASPPQVVAGTASSFGPAMAESAKRALLMCQPFTMLRKETYDMWKDLEINFDPRDMFRG